MEPIISDAPAMQRNVPRDLLARLYREIGVSAVAAALGLAEFAPVPNTTVDHDVPRPEPAGFRGLATAGDSC